MKQFSRITLNPKIMGGKPCIRGMRVTVGMILGLLASNKTFDEIIQSYPYIKKEDIQESLNYAAWRLMEFEVELTAA